MNIRIIYFFIIFFCCAASPAWAQDDTFEVEDPLRAFEEQPSASEKFKFFFEVSNRYEENSAYDWMDRINADLSEATRNRDTTAMKAFELMRVQLYYDLGSFQQSVSIANELYINTTNEEPEILSPLLDLMDQNYGQLQLYDKQIEIRKKKKELGLTDQVYFYDIYANLGLYRKAMEDFIYDKKKTIDNTNLYEQAAYHNEVGKFLLMDKSAASALSYFKQAQGYVVVYNNDMTTVKTESEISQAKLLNGFIEGNIGKAHVMLTQYQEALPFLENSISIINEQHKVIYRAEIFENTLYLALAHMELGNLRKAKEYLDRPWDISKPKLVLERNRLLAAYYDAMGDYRNQSLYLKRNVRLRDSINERESAIRRQQMLAIVANEELDNSRQMIDDQRKQLEERKAELKAKDMRTNLVFISLVFTLLGFAGLVYAYLKSIKNQRLIAEQKHIIENSLTEKDSLLKEIHHRVKNNLQMVSSLLSLQTKNTRSKAAIEALEEGKTRVKAMALIHQKLYQNDDLSVIEMQGYIESLINSVQSVFKKGGHNINITIDAEGVELDIDRAIPFGLILNELVSNSFKYAFPEDDANGKIYIHIRKNGDGGFFEYTDNGVGMPDDTTERENESMGIRLIRRLVNQLQSTLNIDRNTEGVRFWFNFK